MYEGNFLMRVAELHKLRQEQAMKIGNAIDDAQETGLATTDRIMSLKCSARVC
jgi:hypothetical protein